jgi:nitrite reductase/ring-hydroxylating ferredoxin subunit
MTSPDGARIAPLADVPDDTTLLFTVRERRDGEAGDADDGEADATEREAVLVRLSDGSVAAWLNYCRHFTHVKLDKGSGAPMRDGELVCANHGAYFAADSGRCTHGPCEGAFLDEVAVTVVEGAVHLADDDYAFAGRGGVDDGDDLTSSSNVEF